MARKLICGVGVNDADYPITRCPYYRKWRDMLPRCYSEQYQNRNPSYREVNVCDTWHTFSVFKMWMEQQEWQCMVLDKDLIGSVYGIKLYSKSTCIFIPAQVNSLVSLRSINNSVLRKRELLLEHLVDEDNRDIRKAIVGYLGTF